MVPHTPRLRERISWFHTVAMGGALAAGFLVAVLMIPRAGQSPVELSSPLIKCSLLTDASRGPSAAASIVYSGQRYTVAVRAASAKRHGWLFQVDSRAAYLIAVLEEQPDGTVAGSRPGTFDDVPGQEYFVIVLADHSLPDLGKKTGRVQWLNPGDIQKLQRHASEEDDTGAVAVIREAIGRIARQGILYDVEVRRVDHRAP